MISSYDSASGLYTRGNTLLTRVENVFDVYNTDLASFRDMYGKAFESMYSGSMVGAGINVFAVWNYVIAKTRKGVVELNPKLLAAILGGTEEEIQSAMDFLQKEDLNSRSKAEDGRRLIREGQFQYRVVNWQAYAEIRREEDRREYNRLKQIEYRARKKKEKNAGQPLPGESGYVKDYEEGRKDKDGFPIDRPKDEPGQ